ncbi:MAG: HD domain-containing protein [Chloroherpetonaceae bacterium]|nr:HD domain-containing protein [Chthonomonadaceae bacterium]MDW8208842.1 HD domain-containing protein [Chloroherpetonaceae bacterium]
MNAKLNAILELARRYNYDAGHAHQVECLAGTLFMETEPLHQLGREDRKLLEYAAILHDIGYYVSARGHHRHTLQMIMMEPLPEFSREEKTVIANIARYHRKALPTIEHTAFGILSDEDKRRVSLLAPLLRIADALDRSHQGLVQELFCDLRDDALVIYAGSSTEMPVETAALDRRADMFRQVYRRDAQLRVLRPRLPEGRREASFAFEAAGSR